MKLIYFLILIFILLQSCKADSLKNEINNAFKTRNTQKLEILLDKYLQINGTDEYFNKNYLKLTILKGNLKNALTVYGNIRNIKIKKDEEILKSINKLIVKESKKIPAKQKTDYYRTILKYYPYSPEIYRIYIAKLLKTKSYDKALKAYMSYIEIFDDNNNMILNKILFYKLKSIYETKKEIEIFKLITQLKNREIKDFFYREILKDNSLLTYMEKIPFEFDTDKLKKFMISDNFSVRKQAFYLFIKFGNKEEVQNFIKKIYKNIKENSLKILIITQYYKRFKELIDQKTIENFLNTPKDICKGVKTVNELKLTVFSEKIKEILGSPSEFKCTASKLFLLKTLFKINRKKAKNFVDKLKERQKEKIKDILLEFNLKVNCENCIKTLKNPDENEENKAIALNLLIKAGKDISFFTQYDNIVYYNIFWNNRKYLSKEQIKKLIIISLEKWKDYKMLIYASQNMSTTELEDLFNTLTPKIKDKFFTKNLYYAVMLRKTDNKNGEFENFILKKRFFKNYIKMYKFKPKHIKILIKVYIKENNKKNKFEIIKKIIETLNEI